MPMRDKKHFGDSPAYPYFLQKDLAAMTLRSASP
jgi:hypothetical protein